jgi:hypothetical protein
LGAFGECQVMSQPMATRWFVSPLIYQDFRDGSLLLAGSNHASATLNHQKCARARKFWRALVEEGLPKTQIFLWIYGEQLRAVFDNVVLAEYCCRYDGQARKVADIRKGQFYATRFASSQGFLIPWTPQESVVVYRTRSRRRRTLPTSPVGQLCLFELLSTG